MTQNEKVLHAQGVIEGIASTLSDNTGYLLLEACHTLIDEYEEAKTAKKLKKKLMDICWNPNLESFFHGAILAAMGVTEEDKESYIRSLD